MPRHFKTPGVFVREIRTRPRPIEAVTTSVTAFIGPAEKGPLNRAVRITSRTGFARRFGRPDPATPLGQAVEQYFANGGEVAYVVRVSPGNPGKSGGAYSDGLRALDEVGQFNLLVLAQPSPGRDVEIAGLKAALGYCRERGAILLVDPRGGWSSPEDVLDRTSGIDSLGLRDPNAALFYPNLLLPDPGNPGANCVSPPGGSLAGLIARTDRIYGVWKAPAGIQATLRGVAGFERTLTQQDNRLLNQAGINCLRSFSRFGPVCWGARTLAGIDALASEWKYLPVRRTALYIEQSLQRGLDWAVFEPNDANLWAAMRASTENFLATLFTSGALAGASPDKAYFVKCDATTTTQHDIDLGRVNILVGFAPVRPAEFVILRIQQKAGQSRS